MESQSNQIERMTTTGTFLPAFNVPTAGAWPHGPTVGSDGNVWFAELNANKIARMTMAGQITELALPQASSSPDVMTSAADGVYFTEYNVNKVARVNLTTFAITQWSVPTAGSQPVGITTGGDGNLYFTERTGNKVGILPVGGGSIVEYPLPTASALPDKITLGPDGNLWFTEHSSSELGRLY
jgi:virginiamycin B lyase